MRKASSATERVRGKSIAPLRILTGAAIVAILAACGGSGGGQAGSLGANGGGGGGGAEGGRGGTGGSSAGIARASVTEVSCKLVARQVGRAMKYFFDASPSLFAVGHARSPCRDMKASRGIPAGKGKPAE